MKPCGLSCYVVKMDSLLHFNLNQMAVIGIHGTDGIRSLKEVYRSVIQYLFFQYEPPQNPLGSL